MSDHEKSDREKPPPWRSEPDQRGLGVWYMALYALVLAALALVNVLVVFDAGTQDHQALQNEKRTVLAILNARLAALSSNAADNAVWTEAYQHLVVRFDRDWMLANYNDSFYKSYQADRLLLVGPDGRILHFLFRGMAGSGGAILRDNPDLARLVAAARAHRPDASSGVSGFALIDGQLNLVGASRIAPNEFPVAAGSPAPGIVFVLTTIVDDAFLASIPPDYGVGGLHVLPGLMPADTATPTSTHSALQDGIGGFSEPAILEAGAPEGGPRAAIAWIPHRRGDAFMRVVLPPVLVLSLLIAVFGVIVIRHLQENTRQLTHAYIAAAAGSDAKSRFLAMMSHELRTPLNSVIGFAEIMRDELFGPLGSDKYREYIAHICASGTHLLAVINDVLDFSALTGGGLTLHESRFDLDATVASTVAILAPLADHGQVSLSADGGIKDLEFLGDRQRITQILLNLLSNAIKFTPEGGRVGVGTQIDETGSVSIVVRDTGIGLPADDIPKALELFGQIDSALARRYEGTGLGLPLARLLVELHGGTLEIVGTKGVGTTVTVRFPAFRSDRSTVAATAELS
jgi:signal transduction histidine kinase